MCHEDVKGRWFHRDDIDTHARIIHRSVRAAHAQIDDIVVNTHSTTARSVRSQNAGNFLPLYAVSRFYRQIANINLDPYPCVYDMLNTTFRFSSHSDVLHALLALVQNQTVTFSQICGENMDQRFVF